MSPFPFFPLVMLFCLGTPLPLLLTELLFAFWSFLFPPFFFKLSLLPSNLYSFLLSFIFSQTTALFILRVLITPPQHFQQLHFCCHCLYYLAVNLATILAVIFYGSPPLLVRYVPNWGTGRAGHPDSLASLTTSRISQHYYVYALILFGDGKLCIML